MSSFKSTENLLENDENQSSALNEVIILKRNAFNESSSSEHLSPKQKLEQIVEIHHKPPVPVPRKRLSVTKSINDSKESLVNSQNSSSSGGRKSLFFAESRSNTIIDYQTPIRNVLVSDESCSSDSVKRRSKSRMRKESIECEIVNEKENSRTSESTESDELDRKARRRKLRKTQEVTELLNERRKKRRGSRDDRIGYSYCKIIGIHLHDSTELKFNNKIGTPRIRISIYNLTTKKLLLKSDPTRNVVTNHEPDLVDFIQPVISNECQYKTSSFIPKWDELLILNEDINHIQQGNEIIFFEVIDLFPNDTNWFYQKTGANMFKICWAFLKPFPDQKFTNIDKRSRLQLYEYQKNKEVPIFDQWTMERKKYPGFLDVTVESLVPSSQKSECSISRTSNPLEIERTENILLSDEEVIETQQWNFQRYPSIEFQMSWKKLPGQAFKCPNTLLHKRKISKKGSFVVKFNHDGHLMAFTSNQEIEIVTVPKFKNIVTLNGHSSLIYELDWLDQNSRELTFPQYLVSSSSDKTSILWIIERNSYSFKILPHPSFVYSSKFVSTLIEPLFLITGCRDNAIRVWKLRKSTSKIELHQEYPLEHDGYVTSVVVTKSGEFLYSSDSCGSVIEWKITIKRAKMVCIFSRKIKICDEIITRMVLHPKGRKFFLQISNKSQLKVMDRESGIVVQTFGDESVLVNMHHTKFTISPCGSLLLLSPENGIIQSWNVQSGKLVETITENFYQRSNEPFISFLDYHPKDSYLAISVYGCNGGVALMGHSNIEVSGKSEELVARVEKIELNKKKTGEYRVNLTELLKSLDNVFMAPSSSSSFHKINSITDDGKILAKQKQKSSSEVSGSDHTFTIDKNELSGTFIIEKPKPPRVLQKKSSSSSENKTFSVHRSEKINDNTFEIDVGNQSDDTTISESLQSEK